MVSFFNSKQSGCYYNRRNDTILDSSFPEGQLPLKKISDPYRLETFAKNGGSLVF